MFTHDLFARTHFEYFKQDDKSFMTIQEQLEREQRSQAIFTNTS
jgi:hypothetical protein